MNEENQMINSENIRSERERLNTLIFFQMNRLGQTLINKDTSPVAQAISIQTSLKYIHSLTIAYHTPEYTKKYKKLNEELNTNCRIDQHSEPCPECIKKYAPLIKAYPLEYINILMKWLAEMNPILQRAGFVESGRETYTIQDKKTTELEETPQE